MDERCVVPSGLQSYYDDWQMSPGRTGGGLLFMTGMTGHRPDGSFADDPGEQIREAFAKVESVLTEAGTDWSAVVEMTSFHLGLHQHIDIFRQVRAENVEEPYPAWTAIEVAGFVTPGAIVELRVVAAMATA